MHYAMSFRGFGRSIAIGLGTMGLHCETVALSMLDGIVWAFENALFAGEEVRSKKAQKIEICVRSAARLKRRRD